MANPPRQFHEGYWYHVYARGQEEVRLFSTPEERTWFLNRLDDTFRRRKVGLGALCLLDTHYHALVRMGPVELGRVLNGLHMSYAKYLNRRRDRGGSVFRSHPGTDIILDDAYLLQLVPYIHNNPVEAGMVDDPGDYEWSTDALYRKGEWDHGPLQSWRWPPNFRVNPRRTYLEKMSRDVGLPEGGVGYVGTSTEWTNLEKRREDRGEHYRDRRDRRSLEEIAREQVESTDLSVEDLKAPGRTQPGARLRQEAMAAMYEEGYGPKEIGNFFRRNKGTVMHAVNVRRSDG